MATPLDELFPGPNDSSDGAHRRVVKACRSRLLETRRPLACLFQGKDEVAHEVIVELQRLLRRLAMPGLAKAEAQLVLGHSFERLGESADAAASYRAAVETCRLAPGASREGLRTVEAYALLGLAGTGEQAKDPRELLTRVIELDPSIQTAWLWRAHLEALEGDFLTAADTLSDVLGSLNPDDAQGPGLAAKRDFYRNQATHLAAWNTPLAPELVELLAAAAAASATTTTDAARRDGHACHTDAIVRDDTHSTFCSSLSADDDDDDDDDEGCCSGNDDNDGHS